MRPPALPPLPVSGPAGEELKMGRPSVSGRPDSEFDFAATVQKASEAGPRLMLSKPAPPAAGCAGEFQRPPCPAADHRDLRPAARLTTRVARHLP